VEDKIANSNKRLFYAINWKELMLSTIGWLLIGGTIVNITYNILLYSVPGLHWVQYTLLSGAFTTAMMSVLLYYNNGEVK